MRITKKYGIFGDIYYQELIYKSSGGSWGGGDGSGGGGSDGGRQFKTIIAGFAYPEELKPGAIILLGELRHSPAQLVADNHIHVLFEFFALNVQDLIEEAIKLRRDSSCSLFVKKNDPRDIFIEEANRELRRNRQLPLKFIRDIYSSVLGENFGNQEKNFYLSLLQKRIVNTKSLFFNDNFRVKDELMRLDDNNSREKMNNSPGALALFMALAELDLNQKTQIQKNKRILTDKLGGY